MLFKTYSCEGMASFTLFQLDADVLCVCIYVGLLGDTQS